MKGVSEFIEVLIILIIAIASISVVWLFYNSMFGSVTTAENTHALDETLSSCMKIDSVKDNKVYLKNCGDGAVTNSSLRVYFDDAPVNFSMVQESISKGEIGTITLYGLTLWDMETGENHKIKITSPSGKVERFVKAVLPSCDDSRCVLYMKFDEGSGIIAHDSSRYGNNGILGNGSCSPGLGTCPKWVKGKYGYALNFNGLGFADGDRVNVSNSSSLVLNKFSIEAWFYINRFPGAVVPWGTIIQESWDYNNSFWLGVVNGTEWNGVPWEKVLLFGTRNNTGNRVDIITPNNTLKTNTWYHTIATYNGSYMKLFLNDQKLGEVKQTGILNINNFTVIGHHGYIPSTLNGTIDELKVYNATDIVLTLPEMA